MANFAPSRVARLAVAALLLAASPLAAQKSVKKAEQSPWQMAEEARSQLLAIPADQRTAEDYRTVMDAYRLIYHGNPGDTHAPESVYQVGALLAEQGAVLHDTRSSQNAIGQFEFLRKNYPTSSLRIPALLEEAHVATNNLRDVKLAREKYAEYLSKYPHSLHAPEAQAALQSLRAGTLPTSAAAASQTTATATPAQTAAKKAAASNGVPATAVPQQTRADASIAASRAIAPPPQNSGVQDAAATVPAHTKSGLATVSAIRHWSTPTYTRVAIDLGDEVKYEAARVPSPDRIYFDLHGTRLATELSGKSFTVTDDGFLKRIRAAQYSNDMTRVVLDVNDVTEYSAFLLPNPYRLIIDIHGASKSTKAAAEEPPLTYPDVPPTTPATTPKQQQPAAKTQPQQTSQLPVMPPTQSATQTQSLQAAVPSTVATRSTSSKEVTALSTQPDQQRATVSPTSQPIAAVIADPRYASIAASRKAKKDKEAAALAPPAKAASPVHAADPTAAGERSLVRALGLKIGRIVIDPGHGGHDSGTLGAGGIMEKDVVLDVALRLGRMLHDKLGAEVIFTRSDDTFIPLETRTAIANKAEADLFISVHANSSQDETARGVETYYLNFTSQPDALDVAARENAVSDQSVHQLADLVKKITLKDKIEESREFAADVDKSLYEGLKKGNEGLKDRGVKKAPFVVLIGANMPSILTEISFVTNTRDAAQLRTPEYRQRVAESIYRGVARYTSGLSGVRSASTPRQDTRGE